MFSPSNSEFLPFINPSTSSYSHYQPYIPQYLSPLSSPPFLLSSLPSPTLLRTLYTLLPAINSPPQALPLAIQGLPQSHPYLFCHPPPPLLRLIFAQPTTNRNPKFRQQKYTYCPSLALLRCPMMSKKDDYSRTNGKWLHFNGQTVAHSKRPNGANGLVFKR